MKNITMAIAGLGLLIAGSAQAANVGNFGGYAQVNSNAVASSGVQVEIPAEGRLSAYSPAEEVVAKDVQVAVSSQGRLSGYGS